MNKQRSVIIATLLAATAASGSSGCAAKGHAGPAQVADEAPWPRAIGERLARAFADSYVDAALGARVAAHVHARLQTGAYDTLQDEELANALQEDVRGIVDDRHIRVMFDATRVDDPPRSAPAGPPPAPPSELLEELRRDSARLVSASVLDGNVGYVKVDGFPPPEALSEAITSAMQVVRDTRALIVDVRDNSGGAPSGVALLLSFVLDDPPRVVNTLEFRSGAREQTSTSHVGELAYGAQRPLYVLTSMRTFSGGEEFAYDVQAMQRGVLVGETTAGAANPGGIAVLGQGYSVFVPFGRAINPITGESWEGTGVRPDVAVPAEDALERAAALANGSGS
jgi:retinol-binding protein 3